MRTRKNFILLGAMAILVVIGLAGCGDKRVEPKEAAQVTMNALLYNEDTKKLDSIYDGDFKKFEKEFKKGFKTGFKNSLQSQTQTTVSDEKVEEFYKVLVKQIKKKVKYTAKVTKDDKEKPEIEISGKGLDLKTVQDNVIKGLQDEIKKDASLATDKTKLTDRLMDLYIKEIPNAGLSDSTIKTVLSLQPDKDDKNKWVITNQAAFIQVVGQFYMGGM